MDKDGLFAQIGQAVSVMSRGEPMKSDEVLVSELAEATTGLMMMSESDYPFATLRFDAKTAITPRFLHTLAREDESAPVVEQSVDDFFRAAVSEPDWKKDEELKTARRYQSLVRLLKENLSDLKVYRVGAVNISVFIIGRSGNQTLLGLSTRVIET